ncbi:MAG: hypothetical protein LBR26_12330 [Prevotella sp.]|nr:hypothetical protein [Prevotella sp.]
MKGSTGQTWAWTGTTAGNKNNMTPKNNGTPPILPLLYLFILQYINDKPERRQKPASGR